MTQEPYEPYVTGAEIDAGGKALRERQQAGRITRLWEQLPQSEKRKWHDHALAVLIAAKKAAAP